MNIHQTRFRGIASSRADGSNPNAILGELQKAFAAFKEENDKALADIRKGTEDVVRTEKVDRINNAISDLEKELDRVNAALSASRIGGAGNAIDPDVQAHAQAFNQFFRKGGEAGLRDLEIKAKLTSQSDPDGGYLVPTETENTIDRVLGKISVMRSLARVIPISTQEYKKLVNMGGASSGWVGEEELRPNTGTPKLREISLNVCEIFANPYATQTLLDDASIDIASWLADEVSIEFAEQEGDAFVNGDGIKRPRGLLKYDVVDNENYTWGKVGTIKTGNANGFIPVTASDNPADCLIDLYYALKRGYRINASWAMSDNTMSIVRKFKNADGEYIWAPPSGAAEVATILGKSVHSDDNFPKVASNALPIAFGDFHRAYTIVDRIGIRILRDPFTFKPYIQFYTTKRVGGGVTNFEAYKLLKVST